MVFYLLGVFLRTKTIVKKTMWENELSKIYDLSFLCFHWCTLMEHYCEQYIIKCSKRWKNWISDIFANRVQSSFSVSYAVVFIVLILLNIHWNQHAQLKWWVIKSMYHKKNGNGDSDVRAMAIYLRNKQLNTMQYIYDRKGYDGATICVLVRIDLFGLWFHWNRFILFFYFLCSGFFYCFLESLFVISYEFNTKHMYSSWNCMLLRNSFHNMIYL